MLQVTTSNSQVEIDTAHARDRPCKRLRGGDIDAGEAVRDVDDAEQQGLSDRTDTPDDVAGLEAGGGDEEVEMNNPLMYSLERRFLSQQLETPLGVGPPPGGGGHGAVSPIAEENEDGKEGYHMSRGVGSDAGGATEDSCEADEPLFRIKSQLTYERGNSHSQFSFGDTTKDNNKNNYKKDRTSTATGVERVEGGACGPRGWETPCFEGTGLGVGIDEGMQRELSANDLGNVLCRFITTDTTETVEETDKELRSSRLEELQIPSSSQDLNNESDAENRLTPAVHSADRVQLNSVNGFFPIFRSKKDCKVVYLIRHGESEFNAACSARGSSWEDPLLFDARLTCKGKCQALTLRNEVQNWDLPTDVVWVTSPLTRAIQTLLHVHPHIEVLAPENGTKDHHITCRTASGQLDNVIVLPEVTEKLHTSGDVGRNPCDLSKEFPMLKGSLSGLENSWWYNRTERPNCSYKQLFQSHETKDSVTRRVKYFRKWIIDRPEKVFVAVGHSMFWKEFATSVHNGVKQDTLRNCEWRVLHV